MCDMKNKTKFLNGIQINPLSFVDEGVEKCIDNLKNRFHINSIFLCTVSWLALKIGRSISFKYDGWPDHGVNEPIDLKGGAYFRPNEEYYSQTHIKDFYTKDELFENIDIVKDIIDCAKKYDIKVYVELMEPFFKYDGHGSIKNVDIPNIVNCLETDLLGRISGEPSTFNKDYRNWIKAIIEDQCRTYNIDGVMWCNERCSPLDQLIQGIVPTDFSIDFENYAVTKNIDVCKVKESFLKVINIVKNSKKLSFIEFLNLILYNPEILIWEKLWLENNKNLDKELYGLVKWINSDLEFGLNIWNRNHFSPLRKAQWPWNEVTDYCDWVKPITYQHQGGSIYRKEIDFWNKNIFDYDNDKILTFFNEILNFETTKWDLLIEKGLNPDNYVFNQCYETVNGVDNEIPVYMGIGVDAPSYNSIQSKCTPEIVYESVINSINAGASGIIYSPNYNFMKFSNLDGAVKALDKLEIL